LAFTCSLIGLVLLPTVRGQNHGLGATLDLGEYLAQPVVAAIARRDYENLPAAYSLKEYCPTPGDQGETGTCTAWSSAYYARTILEAIAEQRKGASANDAEAFSPSFIYNQIRDTPGCDDGTSLAAALEIMQEQGCLKASVVKFDCDFDDWDRFSVLAQPFTIRGHLRLHGPVANNKVLPVKKALASGQPVLIGMHVTKSFMRPGSDGFYRPTEEDLLLDIPDLLARKAYSGHAMAVIGYDDMKGKQGAVQIINSWGSDWGDAGFGWVEYADFNRFVAQSFTMLGQPIYKEELAGMFVLETERGEQMLGQFDPARGAYRLAQQYPAKTRFRIYLKNDKPVYLYAFGFDQTGKTFDVFPHQKGVSPYIPYDKAHIPIPDEDHFIEIDDVKARNDLCVIYSVKELPIEELKAKLQARGDQLVLDKVPLRTAVVEELKALGALCVPAEQVTYRPKDFSFQAKRADEVCVPIILEFGS
jgi:hypothetical protein